MANKIIYWVIVGAIIAGILSVIYWVVYPLIVGVTMEFYIRLGLLFLGIITFGVLRMYNAIVSNTKFLIKLRQTLAPLTNDIINLRTHMGRLGSRVTKNTDALRGLGDNFNKVTESMTKLKASVDNSTDKRNRK